MHGLIFIVETLIVAAAPQPGEHVIHVGAGVGYYTTILAKLIGAEGRVTAIEFDAELAARAMANLAQAPHVRVVHRRWHASLVRTPRPERSSLRARP